MNIIRRVRPAKTPRRRARTLVLGALIPATLAAGLVTAATATAAAPDTATRSAQVQVSQPQYSRGFNVTNKASHSLKLVSLDGDFDSAPAVGHVLPPNGNDHFEVTYWLMHENSTHATYDILDAHGAKIDTYTADMNVWRGDGISEENCHIDIGWCTPWQPENSMYTPLPPLYIYDEQPPA